MNARVLNVEARNGHMLHVLHRFFIRSSRLNAGFCVSYERSISCNLLLTLSPYYTMQCNEKKSIFVLWAHQADYDLDILCGPTRPGSSAGGLYQSVRAVVTKTKEKWIFNLKIFSHLNAVLLCFFWRCQTSCSCLRSRAETTESLLGRAISVAGLQKKGLYYASWLNSQIICLNSTKQPIKLVLQCCSPHCKNFSHPQDPIIYYLLCKSLFFLPSSQTPKVKRNHYWSFLWTIFHR